MAALEKASVNRLDLAEQVLQSWEQMLTAGELSVENLPLARNEVANLSAYRKQDPAKVDDLMKRFQAIADFLSRQIN